MKRFLMLLPIIAVALIPLFNAFGQKQGLKKLSEADIVTLSELQIDDDCIVKRLQKSDGPGFEVTNEVLQRLEKAGVSETVLTLLRNYRAVGSFVPNAAIHVKIPAVKGEEFYCMDFITPSVGYVASNKAIYKTEDAGKRWQKVLEAEFLSGRTGFIRFLNEKTGWIHSNGKLYITRDGGKTWLPDGDIAGIWNMGFAPDGQVFVCGRDGRYLQPLIYRKKHLNGKWERVALNGQADKGFPYTSAVAAVIPIDAKNIFAIRDQYFDYNDCVMHSGDGGKTWKLVYERDSVTDCHFDKKGRGWVLSGSAILHTDDGGNKWQPALNAVDRHGIQMAFDPKGSSFGVILLGYTGESDRTAKILVTRDGKKWTAVNIGELLKTELPYIGQVDVVNPSCVYLFTGQGDLIRYHP